MNQSTPVPGPGGPDSRERITALFGPLPRLHKLIFVVVCLAACAGTGAWLAHVTSFPVVAGAGALLGAGAGVIGVYALFHESRHSPA